jgi:hypothetical protein
MNKTIKEHPDSYNGWTNYATWRVNLEILGDMDWYETEHARVFLSEVNYHEILEHILDEKEIEKQIENE